jgi:hypothetical protein
LRSTPPWRAQHVVVLTIVSHHFPADDFVRRASRCALAAAADFFLFLSRCR